MPRAPTSSKKAVASQPKTAGESCSAFPDDDDDLQGSQTSSGDGSVVGKGGKKRPGQNYMVDEQQDFTMEMQKMLDCFGADITKTLLAKRKRLEQYTQSSLKSTNRKVDDVWRVQQNERNKLTGEFQRQVAATFQQWETDLEKSKEQEEKLQNILRQQQKLFQQTRIIQTQRLKSIKQLHEQYIKGMEELEKSHNEQQGGVVQTELKKEMALLQKKILMDTQQQEITSMKKSLQTMLF